MGEAGGAKTSGVRQAAAAVLLAGEPEHKRRAAHALAQGWRSGALTAKTVPSDLIVPDRPARPNRPELVAPGLVKRRRLGTVAGRAALLHAVAHIEFNAIDLAADLIARFGQSPFISEPYLSNFISDWVGVCDDEARHFGMVCDRLAQLGVSYGDLPAHDGLWQAAQATREDFIARLAIAPMVLEARGLDVTPAMIAKLKAHNDPESAAILQCIYDDEIGHVAAGSRWFKHVAQRDSQDGEITLFHIKVRQYFNGLLKPPFNRAARDLAGMPLAYYEPLSQQEHVDS